MSFITKSYLYNFYPLKPHFNIIVKLGFTGVYIIFFLFLPKNIDCVYSLEPPWRDGFNEYPQSVLSRNMKKISEVLYENFQFLAVKLSIYLNRRVNVRVKHILSALLFIRFGRTPFYVIHNSTAFGLNFLMLWGHYHGVFSSAFLL